MGAGNEVTPYYKLMWSDTGHCGVAYAPASFQLWLQLHQRVLPGWVVPIFELRDGPFADYQPSDAVTSLCSQKMQDIIERHRHPGDSLEWLPVVLRDEEGEERPYYILHLLEELDVIDEERSIMNARGRAVKPHLILAKIGQHQIFSYKGSGGRAICMSAEMHDALLEMGCSCCHFWKMPGS